MVDSAIQWTFRFTLYASMGLVLETVFAVDGIERVLGYRLARRVPKKYLEGFVSLYMIPMHGLGMLFGYEWCRDLTREWFIGFRWAWWAAMITSMEIAWGFFLDKVLGFYSWDYYAKSKFRIFGRGYSLWTLVPLWGVPGLFSSR